MKFMQRADSNSQLKRLKEEQEKRKIEQNWTANKIDAGMKYEIEPSFYALSQPKTRLSFGKPVGDEVKDAKAAELTQEVAKLTEEHLSLARGQGRALFNDPQYSSELDHQTNTYNTKPSRLFPKVSKKSKKKKSKK